MSPLRHPLMAFVGWLAFASPSRSDVVISEIQSSNESTVLDDDGDASDWVELLNRGNSAVNLAGWGLSDRQDDPFKWKLPAVSIGPGARLLVWCSGKDRSGTGSGLTADSPDDIPGLVLWLRAEGESHSNGEATTTWTDLSGRGNHGTAPSSATRPVFRTNRLNGKPAFQFTRSSSQAFRLPVAPFNGLLNLHNFTFYSVAKWTGTGSPSGIFGAWNASDSSTDTALEIDLNGEARFRAGLMSPIGKTAAVAGNEWSVLSTTMAGSLDAPLARLFKNGRLIGSRAQSPGTVLLSQLQEMAIGSAKTGRNLDGEIAEVLLYDRPLAAAELAFLDIHLGTRYVLAGATLPLVPKIHTSFSIDANGEDLVLTRPGGVTEDLVPAAKIPQGASRGRSPENGSALVWFATPTPGEPNGATSYGAPLVKPVLSEPRGFKETSFQLAITHPDPAATLRYTLDGSEPSLTNGSTYSAPLAIAATRIVRAAAFKTGALPNRQIATCSYFFLSDIVGQKGTPPGYPAEWGDFSSISYGMDPATTQQAGYAARMKTALSALPTLSLSLSTADAFGPSGVYSNPETPYEKIVSAEWMSPSRSFDTQIDAGLSIHGGASRFFAKTPKKTMRLHFRGELGEGRLRAPVLADGGTALADFNTLVLRGNFNNSWVHIATSERARGILFRDQFMRDTQALMNGGVASHGNFVHLYINGKYWGIYNPSEKPDAAFSATNYGGEPEDYDAMNHNGVVSGDNIAWNAMRAIAQAGLATPAQYAAIQQYLEIDPFIDYMLLNIWGSNQDWPDNNWAATRLRRPGAGYRFFVWDAEKTMESVTSGRTTPPDSDFAHDNPGVLYMALRQNAEFRLRFADRVQKHFFNGGTLTPALLAQRFSFQASKVRIAAFGEQARWGAYRNTILDYDGPSPVYTVDTHWIAERDRLLNSYFPARTTNVLAQLKTANLYPAVNAPALSQHGGQITAGQTITITAGAGTIYYTLDGSDPRAPVSAAVSASALPYSSALTLNGPKTLKARVLSGGTWSALTESEFYTVLPETRFLPGGSADWSSNPNWTTTPYPNAPGERALVHAPTAADRDISLRAPVTIGSVRFTGTDDLFRNRVRDQLTGNTLTFNGGGKHALLQSDGTGLGYVELEVNAGNVLATSLEVQVNHFGGDQEYGALRLRGPWSGPGGIRKTGPGIATMTGDGKYFTGPLLIQEGVLQLTGPATPPFASAVSVSPGGQLRLTSGSDPGELRYYGLDIPLAIAGNGRSPFIPTTPGGPEFGRLGALRYDPGSDGNHAILAFPVELTAAAGIHVEGPLNRLGLSEPLVPVSRALSKSGSGILSLSGDNSGFTGAVTVSEGSLELSGPLGSSVSLGISGTLTGHGSTGPLAGSGTLKLDGNILTAPTLNGTVITAVLANPGSPSYLVPWAAGNGLLSVDAIAVPPKSCRIYLPNPGSSFRGVLFAPSDVDLAAVLHATPCEVYQANGPGWSLVPSAQVATMPESADFGSGPVTGRIVEVRLGAAPASFAAWQGLAFPVASDRNSPLIGGPDADPRHGGIPNLLRYALGLGSGDDPSEGLPRLARLDDRWQFRFPFDPGRDDIDCVVEATSELGNWGNAEVLFDSRHDFARERDNGWIVIETSFSESQRFFRLRVVQR
ncbi:chitobiase/beta-hexosaminidase C-terminal domain-containing protein [Luteolibacter sp. Populi]|uniref:FN3 associated domain-containing protein n=1 Tax=Luteolibacter sp. Populi TaxID=3230487 RepID=UPI0034666DAA